MKHKHAEMIKAWADGAKIQFRDSGQWWDTDEPSWNLNFKYRIKPELQEDVVKKFYLESNATLGLRFSEAYSDMDLRGRLGCIKCTFSYDTGMLTSVEML